MTIVRRSAWLNDRASVLVARLGEYDMTLPEATAREVISNHLDTTAKMMRIGRQAAKFYVSDDVINKIADRILGLDPTASDGAREPDVISIAQRRKQQQS